MGACLEDGACGCWVWKVAEIGLIVELKAQALRNEDKHALVEKRAFQMEE